MGFKRLRIEIAHTLLRKLFLESIQLEKAEVILTQNFNSINFVPVTQPSLVSYYLRFLKNQAKL